MALSSARKTVIGPPAMTTIWPAPGAGHKGAGVTAGVVPAPARLGGPHPWAWSLADVPCVLVRATFCGVRGSTPAPGAEFVRVGGHTSCVALSAGPDDGPPRLLLDAGTGIRRVPA